MKLAVLGATGVTGQHVVTQALAAGHEVKVLVRDAAKIATSHPSLTVMTGSATVAVDVERLISGCDAVISTLGPREKADPICAVAAEALVAAMKKQGVRRVVWTSASGVGDSREAVNKTSFIFGRIILPLFLTRPYANHAKAEETLRASGLDFTVVRPLQLVDKQTGKPPTPAFGDEKLGGLKIARQDVATFLLQEAVAPKFSGKMPMLFA